MKPKVLIATTYRWLPTARLAMALEKAGCRVEAVCPAGHPLRLTSVVGRTHRFNGLAPQWSLMKAITAMEPDLIVSGDDVATRYLHRLYGRERARGAKGAEICALIERSFGRPESFPVVYQRATFMRLAEELGVRVPKTASIANVDALKRWTAEIGFPVVLKVDGSSGGEGVRIAHNFKEAEQAFHKLHAPPLLARAAKRALIDHDSTLVWPSLLRQHSVVNAQAFVEGRDATSTVACRDGEILGALHFEVLNKRYLAGPASVLRLIENREMTSAVETMVRRLGLSGIHGFDFVIDNHSGAAHLIEINPRSTQVGHITLGPGRDLPAALTAAVTGGPVNPASRVTESDTIALFPQEWSRDPGSPYLRSSHHDVPWEEPGLIRACVRRARKQNRSLTQHDWETAVAQLTNFPPHSSPQIPPR